MSEPRPNVLADGTEPAATGVDARIPEVRDWQLAADAGHERRGGSAASATSVAMPAALMDELVAWCLEGRPNEACGLIAGSAGALDGGAPTRFLPLSNAAASPYRYLIDPDEQLHAMLDIDDTDEVVWGIVHSHVMSPAVPSDTDVGLAAYPDALYLICSLAGDVPHVRGWAIRDGAVTEVALRVI